VPIERTLPRIPSATAAVSLISWFASARKRSNTGPKPDAPAPAGSPIFASDDQATRDDVVVRLLLERGEHAGHDLLADLLLGGLPGSLLRPRVVARNHLSLPCLRHERVDVALSCR
jgi:hypothetical protein